MFDSRRDLAFGRGIGGEFIRHNHSGHVAQALQQLAADPDEYFIQKPLVSGLGGACRRDSRLSGILHVLLHIAERDVPVTSEHLAKAMRTNPVVIRRIMAGLREKGLVRSEKGHGGGWRIARDLSTVTLRDVYEAIGSPDIFAIGHRTEAPDCLVEQSVNAAMDDAFDKAQTLLLERLGEVTLAALSVDFHARRKGRANQCEFERQPHVS
jgi:DNA-binding IscR family transcriptional regulator